MTGVRALSLGGTVGLMYRRTGAIAAFVLTAVVHAAPPQTPLPPPLFSFDLASPAVTQGHVNADDILALNAPYPAGVIPAAVLGLGAEEDELDALSPGHLLFSMQDSFLLFFSVSRETVGSAPPDPLLVGLGFPYNVLDQASRGHQAGDEFMSTTVFTMQTGGGSGNNTLERNNYDEGGSDLSARPETSARSMTVGVQQDNVDALADAAAAMVPYFSVSASSPALTTLPGSATPSGANVFRLSLGQVTLFASFPQLGLQQSDDIDAVVVFDLDGDGVFAGNDRVLFSLTTDSPSTGTIIGASATGAAADVFVVLPSQAPIVFAAAADLGLGAATDDIDGLRVVPCMNALDCVMEHAIRSLTGDFDDDGDIDEDDWISLAHCFSGEGQPFSEGCERGDFDQDSDIDCEDWSSFVDAWTHETPPAALSQCGGPIPATSTWFLTVFVLIVLAVGTSVILQRRVGRAHPSRFPKCD